MLFTEFSRKYRKGERGTYCQRTFPTSFRFLTSLWAKKVFRNRRRHSRESAFGTTARKHEMEGMSLASRGTMSTHTLLQYLLIRFLFEHLGRKSGLKERARPREYKEVVTECALSKYAWREKGDKVLDDHPSGPWRAKICPLTQHGRRGPTRRQGFLSRVDAHSVHFKIAWWPSVEGVRNVAESIVEESS